MSNGPADGLPRRRNPSPGVITVSDQSTVVLLTVGTHKRSSWLANAAAHEILHETWSHASAWLVGDYLLMPDHLHCFCAAHDLNFTLEKWVRYWKRAFAMKHRRVDWKF